MLQREVREAPRVERLEDRSGSRATLEDRIELPLLKAGGAGQSGDGVTFFAWTRGGVLTSR